MTRTAIAFLCGAAAGLVALGGPGLLRGEEDEHAEYGREVPGPEARAEMMRRWQEMATPGKQHERLEYFVGTWNADVRVWMGGDEPAASKGTAEFRWLMEGRWLAQDFEGSMMGRSMTGFGISGYDNFRRSYVGCWTDSWSTSMSTFEGGIDRTGKVIVQYGGMDEPGTGRIGKTAKYVTRIVDGDTFVFEIHDLDIIGGRTKVMEVTYRRKED